MKQTYMEYLEESINTVKSREKLARLIIALATLTIWAVASAVFWMTIAGSNNGIYPLAIIWGILPVTTLTVSVIIGNNNYYGKLKWLAPVCFGILHMLSGYVSFDIGNSMMMKTVLWPGFRMFPIGAVISLIGLAVGVVIHSHKRKKTSEADEKTQVE